jgi:hypothetical protein
VVLCKAGGVDSISCQFQGSLSVLRFKHQETVRFEAPSHEPLQFHSLSLSRQNRLVMASRSDCECVPRLRWGRARHGRSFRCCGR